MSAGRTCSRRCRSRRMFSRSGHVNSSAREERSMNARQLLVLGASVLASSLAGSAVADRMQEPYVRVAEIEIDPAQIEAYKAAINEEIEMSVRAEPGVLALYAVSVKDSPAHIRVFKI